MERGEAYFTVIDNASILMCGKEVSFNDLKIGETVAIRYYTESLGSTRLVTDLKADIKC